MLARMGCKGGARFSMEVAVESQRYHLTCVCTDDNFEVPYVRYMYFTWALQALMSKKKVHVCRYLSHASYSLHEVFRLQIIIIGARGCRLLTTLIE